MAILRYTSISQFNLQIETTNMHSTFLMVCLQISTQEILLLFREPSMLRQVIVLIKYLKTSYITMHFILLLQNRPMLSFKALFPKPAHSVVLPVR